MFPSKMGPMARAAAGAPQAPTPPMPSPAPAAPAPAPAAPAHVQGDPVAIIKQAAASDPVIAAIATVLGIG